MLTSSGLLTSVTHWFIEKDMINSFLFIYFFWVKMFFTESLQNLDYNYIDFVCDFNSPQTLLTLTMLFLFSLFLCVSRSLEQFSFFERTIPKNI